MQINLRALSLTLILAGIISSPVFAAPAANGTTELLNSAKKWEQKNRPDRAKPFLLKVLMVEPTSEEGLFMLGNLELQHGKSSEALRYLTTLEQSAPNSPRTRELSKTYHSKMGDLVEKPASQPAPVFAPMVSQTDSLAKEKPAKPGKDELDEARFHGTSKADYDKAQEELSSLYKKTGDTRYRLIQLELQVNHRESLTSAVTGYEALPTVSGINTQRLQNGWRHSLRKLPDNAYKQQAIKHFLAAYPNDQEMINLLGDVQKNGVVRGIVSTQKPIILSKKKSSRKLAGKKADKHQTEATAATTDNKTSKANDPDIIARTAALDALEDGDLEVAEKGLLEVMKNRPQDPEVLGGLGYVKLRQGRNAEAEQWFSQASAAEKGESARWKGLVITAGFWKNMRAAGDLLEANKLPEAETSAGQALALQADEPNALALLGNIKAAENELVEAERLYRAALAKEGFNVSAIRGLTSLLVRTQRNTEAMELIEQVHKDYPNELNKNPSVQAGLLREEADLYLAAHRPSHAIQALEMAVLLDPKEPWARFSLAKLYVSVGLTPLGKQIMQEGAALSPADPVMHYSRALVLLSVDDYAAGLDSLSKIPNDAMTDAMRDTRNRAQIQYYFQQAEAQLVGGNRKEAIRIMAIAESEARGNYPATEQVAEGWFRLGLPRQGLSAMRKLPQPAPLSTQIYFASLLNRASKDQELVAYLPTLRIPDSTDEVTLKYKATIQNIEFAMAGRQFDKLMKEGKVEQANQFADTILGNNQLSNADYFRYHRNYFSRAELPENAIPLLNQEKEEYPNDLNLRWDLAYAYYQDKQLSNAQREIQELLALTRGDDIDTRLRIAKLQQNMADLPGAHQTVNDLLSHFPNNSDVLLQAGNLARADGQYNEAMNYYQKTKSQSIPKPEKPAAPSVTPTDTPTTPDILLNLLPAKPATNEESKTLRTERISKTSPILVSTRESDSIYRAALSADNATTTSYTAGNAASIADQEMSSIAKSRAPFVVEGGLDIQMKSAGNGTSTYNATEVPLLARFPIGYQARGIVQVDKVDIDAGSLPANFTDASLFGKIQPTQGGLAQPLAQTASGTSVALGYENDTFRADIGEVGIGFPVNNVVGGVRTGGDIGRMSYSLNISRRPYTGSLLSYAGTKDPVTGAVWGGVTNTGITLYMSTTLSTYNVAAMGSYGLLRGINVLNNDRLFLRTTIDTDVYTTDDMALNIGFNANYMSFSQNESFYTFGHGGYYSPQSSVSFGVPITLNGRSNLLSYQLMASASYSYTHENASPYFPTDPALQTRATAGPNFASYYNSAVYPGGNGGGFGYGLRALAEYRMTPNIALGGRFSIDRSAYYAPNALLMYMRYMFKPETGPIKLKPDPVVPYSQY
jgi:tetratricopeptide (TPR) repeat protein